MSNQDYSPILEQGQVVPPAKLRDRRKTPSDAGPATQSGTQVVWFDSKNQSLDGPPTPGELRNLGAARWVVVDLNARQIEFPVQLKDTTGRVGLGGKVKLSVNVRPSHAADVAANPASSVRSVVEQRVYRAVEEVEGSLQVEQEDTLTRFQSLKSLATRKLRAELESRLKEVPNWLEAVVVSIDIELDAASSGHAGTMVGKAHTTAEQKADAQAALERMKHNAETLLPHLTNPHQRIFLKVLDNPTPANIDEAITLAMRVENEGYGYMMQIVEQFVQAGLLDDDKPAHAALLALIESGAKSLASGDRLGAIGSGPADAVGKEPRAPHDHTVEGEVVPDGSERDWTGQSAAAQDS